MIREVTEEEFVELMKEKGFDEWDMEVALGGLKKGVALDLGGGLKFALKHGVEEGVVRGADPGDRQKVR